MEHDHQPTQTEADQAEVTRQISIGMAAVRWIILAAVVVVVAAVGLALVVSNMGDNVKANTETAEQTQEDVDRLDRAVAHIEAFVETIESPSDDEQARIQAVNAAVAQIPEIKSILCEDGAFPEAEACQVP